MTSVHGPRFTNSAAVYVGDPGLSCIMNKKKNELELIKLLY